MTLESIIQRLAKFLSSAARLARSSHTGSYIAFVLPLIYPVDVGQIPLIEKCLEKNDPKEMNEWIKEQVDKAVEENYLW